MHQTKLHILIMLCSLTHYTTSLSLESLEVHQPIDDFIRTLELISTETPSAIAQYVTAAQTTSNLIFISGQLPRRPDFSLIKGKLGSTLTVEQGYYAAHLCGIAIIAQLKSKIGDLLKVRRCIKLTGYVNATPEFTEHSLVINGASDVILQVFGQAGKHARASIGVSSLPLGAAVEIEAIFELF